MATFFKEVTPELKSFIEKQKVFFVATAASNGRINLSPKGLDTFRVMKGGKKLLWLNLTGSGNETAAHLLKNNRMTIMFCAFEGKPLILRLYGHAKIYHERDSEFHEYVDLFPVIAGTRQIIEMTVDSVQTSCGYAIPFMDFKEERLQLNHWAEKQGEERLKNYRIEKNSKSIDGFETNII
ncbi:pyridoxamine 5'-phosphate oxidase family protein [Seonamhaeicola aphaedonensis]|uniref:Pyridoxamine 5'-phosphate oxidase n=1 Tax=Seonamhaeicola aphaedonensis TaxID=1461338 RepID=A0A3D9H8W4_9FLAO|nr:pyridoxamine 5'-phosphate oxidase family protein [Seonamhaeicola aphaedonensis]RED45944.1 pyridoxamine 5'-phosphate oxidase [Seonamhaeicola aphaedonensis]